MKWTARMAEGFAVAALAHDDPEAALARAGLDESCGRAATRVLARLAAEGREARRSFLKAALAPAGPGSAPSLPSSHAGARARGLLASHVERSQGRAWLAAAPHVRSGFTPDAQLVRWLLRASTRSS